jgi:hypothetical protein
VGNDLEPCGVNAFIAVGVVVMPVSIDERVGMVLADGADGLKNAWHGRGEAGVNQDVPIWACLQRHVAACALQQIEIVGKLRGLDGCFLRGGATLRDSVRHQSSLRIDPTRTKRSGTCSQSHLHQASAIHFRPQGQNLLGKRGRENSN